MRNIVLVTTILFASACGNAGGASIAPSTPLVVVNGQAPVTYGQVTTGTPPLSTSTLPAQPEILRTNTSCRTPTASANARAAYVYTYGGGVRTPMHHVSIKDTPEAAAERDQKRREAASKLKAQTKPMSQKAMRKEAMAFAEGNTVESSRQIDVLVTETDAPVFLYLTSYDSVLWNIQRAPGVTIDGIVVNSYDAGVIANGVEADRTAFISFANSPNKTCYVGGKGRAVPVEERVAAARKLNPSIDLRTRKEQWDEEYRDTRRFFRTNVRSLIGKHPEWILNDARKGSFQAVLVGSAPAEPFQAQPIGRLQMPSHIIPYWGTR